MRCSAQALVTLVKAKLRFSRFPKEPELSRRAKSASCGGRNQDGYGLEMGGQVSGLWASLGPLNPAISLAIFLTHFSLNLAVGWGTSSPQEWRGEMAS